MREIYIVRWRKQWRVRSDRIIWVVISKLDAHWRSSEPDLYLENADGRPNTRNFISGAVREGKILGMPHISFHYDDLNKVSFTDGRHRFSWMRDHGAHAMPVTINQTEIARAREMFGSRSRVCRVCI